MEIGKYLLQARKKSNLSQEEVAQSLGVSRQSVSLWECDQTIPTLDNLMALSKLYNVNLSILTGQEEFKNENNTILFDQKKFEENYAIAINNSSKRFLRLALIFLILASIFLLVPVISTGLIIACITFSILSIIRLKTNNNLLVLIFSICLFLANIFIYINFDTIYNKLI